MQAKLTRFFAALLCLLLAAGALAQGRRTVAVYPFASQDVLLGVAVSDRIATALEPQLSVLGPAVTPAFVPPLVAEDGFIRPLSLLSSEDQTGQITDEAGARLLRSALGTDVAVAGEIAFRDAGLELGLLVATPEGVMRLFVTAPQDAPGQLVDKALAVLADRLELDPPQTGTSLDLSSPYGDYVSALSLLTGGFVGEARASLEQALAGDDLTAEERARWSALLASLEAVAQGGRGELPELEAAVALSLPVLDTDSIAGYFEALADYPFADVWAAVLAVEAGDEEAARAAFARAGDYPYGLGVRATYRASRQVEGAEADLEALQASPDLGGLVGAMVAANQLGDVALEKEVLARLTSLAPTFVYPFERLSFIAFDEDAPLAAAEALAVAVRLEPESDLYWTNLGWAYYLLGLLDQSEAASLRAIDLDPSQHIAWFNLGLTYAVTGRLDEAMEAYRQALTLDPEVDDEAVMDLENALELYPARAEVHYALGALYEAEGRREEAATQYALYLEQGGEADDSFGRMAHQRIEFLQAPPPPLAIAEEVGLSLGGDVDGAEPFHPGDRVYPRFELYTPGFELPNQVVVSLRLLGQDGAPVGEVGLSQQYQLPNNTVALVIDELGLDLPTDLPLGDYSLAITVSAEPDRRARAEVPLTVAGAPSLTRQLVSRTVGLRAVGTGAQLVNPSELSAEDGDARLIERLLAELRATAVSAGEVLPEVTQGRFSGMGGQELFEQSSAEDVRDFLHYLLAQGGASGETFTFVDVYAQWALEGAPTE